MADNPGVICYQSADHGLLIGLGIVGIIVYPVGIVSWAAWTTYQYPKRAATGNALKLLYRYRFFFQRFKQDCCLGCNTRNQPALIMINHY